MSKKYKRYPNYDQKAPAGYYGYQGAPNQSRPYQEEGQVAAPYEPVAYGRYQQPGPNPQVHASYGAPAGNANLPVFIQNLSSTQQFLLAAAAGAAVAYVLSDEELRHKIVKAGIKLYGGLAGGWEEIKEQVSDIKAEVQSEQL